MIGRISEVSRNLYKISYDDKGENRQVSAVLRGSFFMEEEYPVIGDYVSFVENPFGDSLITEIQERKSVLKRPDQAGHAIGYVKNIKEQVMVANFDYVFIMTSLNDDYSYNRIARYVSMTLQGGGIPVAILTKADLCNNVEAYEEEIRGLSDRVEVVAISALTGSGIDDLRKYLTPGVTIALIGSSGVGKSTLVNRLCGREVMKTSEIREKDSKGRHTTTARALIQLEGGVTLIDTPGMREAGVCDMDEGINDAFDDISQLIQKCRFSDCSHSNEKGCAVQAALKDGSLSKKRWKLYRSLQQESSRNADMKEIAKKRRQLNKSKTRRGNY